MKDEEHTIIDLSKLYMLRYCPKNSNPGPTLYFFLVKNII